MKHDYKVSTSDIKTVNYLISSMLFDDELTSAEEIEKAGKKIIDKLCTDFPDDYNAINYHVILSFILYRVAQYAMKNGFIAPLAYLRMYAQLKRDEFYNNDDYGAFGDLLETLVRILFIRNLSLVRPSHIAVKPFGENDLISKKYGKIEIGNNGKTWTQGNRYDYMDGDFSAVVYGMFNNSDREKIFDYVINEQYEKALHLVSIRCGYWENKYDFLNDIDNVSRGKGICIKSGSIQCQFNESKYWAFRDKIDGGNYITLAELLNK